MFKSKNYKLEKYVNIYGRTIMDARKIEFFPFSTGSVNFLGKLGPKNKNSQFNVKFAPRLIRICRIQ